MKLKRKLIACCGFLIASITGFGGADRVGAYTYTTYYGTSNPLPTWPVATNDGGGFTRNIYYVRFYACNSGTWTRRIQIIVSSGSVPFYYQSTGCGGAGPATYAVANSGSGCGAISAGTYYGNCQMGL